ncbi:MAG: class D sortase [Wujia sp.]
MEMKMQKRAKRIFEYVCIPIVLAALGFLVLYLALRPVLDFASNMSSLILSESAPEFRTSLATIYDENSNPESTGTVLMQDIEFPSYETCYGRLSCERLGMDVAVFWGDSDRVFREGAGQYIGSFLPGYGGVILLGAHDSMYFEPLQDVREGDEFVIRTNYGIYTYRVTETKIASDDDSEVYGNLADGEQLVMYTCYPFGALIGVKNERFYVFAEQISGPEVVRQ